MKIPREHMPSGNLFIRSDYGVVLPGYIQMEPILLGYIPLLHMIEEAIDAGLTPVRRLLAAAMVLIM